MARVKLTKNKVDEFQCPEGKAQVFLRDTGAPGLAVRATKGAKAFVFQSKVSGNDLRITIGDVKVWNLDAAQAEARRLQTLIDQGIDPRQQRAERLAEVGAKRSAAEAAKIDAERQAAPAMDAWRVYLKARWEKWGELSRRDHERVSQKGGDVITRGRKTTKDGKTQAGALRSLLSLPLKQIDAVRVEAWLKDEVAKRPTHAAMAFRLLRGFLNWCAGEDEYRRYIQEGACSAKKVREGLPKRASKDDCLQREQLRSWFEQVRSLSNPTHAAYLQALLLTGARREELASLRWDDVDFKWLSLSIKDKIEGQRVIPLTPYVAGLLLDLQARNNTPPPSHRILRGRRIENDVAGWKPSQWVFSSQTAVSGRIQEPRIGHNKALAAAGLPELTLHGLRRSFGTLAEWTEVPAGVVAQIMGHKPSAIVEKHYRRRPLDLLRKWHVRIEDWILAEAELKPMPASEVGQPVQAVQAVA